MRVKGEFHIWCPKCGEIGYDDIDEPYIDEISGYIIERLIDGDEIEISYVKCKKCGKLLSFQFIKEIKEPEST